MVFGQLVMPVQCCVEARRWVHERQSGSWNNWPKMAPNGAVSFVPANQGLADNFSRTDSHSDHFIFWDLFGLSDLQISGFRFKAVSCGRSWLWIFDHQVSPWPPNESLTILCHPRSPQSSLPRVTSIQAATIQAGKVCRWIELANFFKQILRSSRWPKAVE